MGLLTQILSSPRARTAPVLEPPSENTGTIPASPFAQTGVLSFQKSLPPMLQNRLEEVFANVGRGGIGPVVRNLLQLCNEADACGMKSTVKAARDVAQRCLRLQAPLLGHLVDLDRLQHHDEVSSALARLTKTVAQSRELLGRLSGRTSSFSPRWLHNRTLKRLLQEVEGAVARVETVLATVCYREQLDQVLSHPSDELASQNRTPTPTRPKAPSKRNTSPVQEQTIHTPNRQPKRGLTEGTKPLKARPNRGPNTNGLSEADLTRVRPGGDGARPSQNGRTIGEVVENEGEESSQLLEAALEAETRGDSEGAADLYERSANLGNHEAAAVLGFMLEHGRGIPRDDVAAAYWYGRAAQAGYQAQNNLGKMYFDGRGVPRNQIEAVGWFLKSAAQGSASAFNNLGICYEDGLGVTADVALAAQFYRQAALRGHLMAIANLAHIRSREGQSQEAQALLETAAKRKLAELLPTMSRGNSTVVEAKQRARSSGRSIGEPSLTEERATSKKSMGDGEVQPFENDSNSDAGSDSDTDGEQDGIQVGRLDAKLEGRSNSETDASDRRSDGRQNNIDASEEDILEEIVRPSTAAPQRTDRRSKPGRIRTARGLGSKSSIVTGRLLESSRMPSGGVEAPGESAPRRASFPMSQSEVPTIDITGPRPKAEVVKPGSPERSRPVLEYSSSRLASRAAGRPTAELVSSVRTPGLLGGPSKHLARLTSQLSKRSLGSPHRDLSYNVGGAQRLARGLSLPLYPDVARMSALYGQRPILSPETNSWRSMSAQGLERVRTSNPTGLWAEESLARSLERETGYGLNRGVTLQKSSAYSPRERGLLREWSIGSTRRVY